MTDPYTFETDDRFRRPILHLKKDNFDNDQVFLEMHDFRREESFYTLLVDQAISKQEGDCKTSLKLSLSDLFLSPSSNIYQLDANKNQTRFAQLYQVCIFFRSMCCFVINEYNIEWLFHDKLEQALGKGTFDA